MTALTAHALVAPPYAAVRRIFLPLGGVLAGLWVVELNPAAAALLAPLNLLTAQMTAATLDLVGLPVAREGVVLTHAGGFACEIYQACTAFTPVALLAAAILPYPASWRARLAGVVVGAAYLTVLNQLRLISVVWVGVYAPQFLEFVHFWLWHALLIVATAGYWLGWVKAARG
jgi:exosortase H (IPTLxxWG-CTERM-specific)